MGVIKSMKKNIEQKIYEHLGIKAFRKMVIYFLYLTLIPFTIRKTKEERRDEIYSIGGNYFIGKVKNIETIKAFKKQLLINALIHLSALLFTCVPNYICIFNGTASPSLSIITILCTVLNIYCIMLQRYNDIRINEFIKRKTPFYEKQKDEVKEELKKEDSLLNEHSYKIVNRMKREKELSFDEIINNASLSQLKKYRERLYYYKRFQDFVDESTVTTEKGKKLKIVFKQNKSI